MTHFPFSPCPLQVCCGQTLSFLPSTLGRTRDNSRVTNAIVAETHPKTKGLCTPWRILQKGIWSETCCTQNELIIGGPRAFSRVESWLIGDRRSTVALKRNYCCCCCCYCCSCWRVLFLNHRRPHRLHYCGDCFSCCKLKSYVLALF